MTKQLCSREFLAKTTTVLRLTCRYTIYPTMYACVNVNWIIDNRCAINILYMYSYYDNFTDICSYNAQ